MRIQASSLVSLKSLTDSPFNLTFDPGEVGKMLGEKWEGLPTSRRLPTRPRLPRTRNATKRRKQPTLP